MSTGSASVVLVEDSVPYAMLVEVLLAEVLPGGVSVRHHETLAAAIEDLREHDADCILLDLSLPDADGIEGVTALMRAGVDAPVVVLSGRDDDGVALAAIEAGAQDYLVKGDERQGRAFGRSIRYAIERRRAQLRHQELLRAKEDRWRTLTHLAPVGIAETDPRGRCIFVNERFTELTGRSREASLGLGWRDGLHPRDVAEFDAAAREALRGGREFAHEVRFVTPDGRTVWTYLTAVLLSDPSGAPAGWLATLVDVTAARQAREDLRLAEREVRAQQQDVLAISALARDASVADDPAPILIAGGRRVLGADFAVLLVHDGLDRLTIAATDGTDAVSGEDVRIGEHPAAGAAACFLSRERVELEDARGDARASMGLVTPSETRTVVFEPVPHGTELLGVLAVGWRHVVAPLPPRASLGVRLLAAELGAALERRRLLDRLRDLARTDPLTGLPNRRVWDERLDLELARVARHDNALCVAMLDLDRFKPYNDRHGHQAGDRLLRETTAAWQGILRSSDLLARLGGDEFALLLPDCDVDCARTIVERVQRVTHVEIGVSAGLVRAVAGEEGAALVARADEAMYAAKGAGRGGIHVG